MFTFDADKLRIETDTSQREHYVRYGGVSLDTMTATEMRAALMEIFNLLYGHLAYAPPAETGENTPSYKEYERLRELVGKALFSETGEIVPDYEEYRLRRELAGEEIVEAWCEGQDVGPFRIIASHWQHIGEFAAAPRLLGFPIVLVEGGNDPGIELADWGDYPKGDEDV